MKNIFYLKAVKLILTTSTLALCVSGFAYSYVFGGYGTATIHNETKQPFVLEAFDWNCANRITTDKHIGKVSTDIYSEKVSDITIQPNSYYKLPSLLMGTQADCDGKSPTMHIHLFNEKNKRLIGSIEWYKKVDQENLPKEDLHWNKPVIENCGEPKYSFFPKSKSDPQSIYITDTYMPEGATGKLHEAQCDDTQSK